MIRAPFDGTVAERLVNVGDLVGEMQKVVFRVVDNRMLQLTATVPSMAMASLRTGLPLVFVTDALPGPRVPREDHLDQPLREPGDRSVRVIAEVPNEPEVLKGRAVRQGAHRHGEQEGGRRWSRGRR